MKAIVQEDLMGCGIACVSCIIGKSYKETKKLFDEPENADSKGYYCKDIISTLKKKNLEYTYSKFNQKHKDKLKLLGTIVFIRRSEKYPVGHYLVRTKQGWMNPWINCPSITPARSGFQKELPGEVQWIIYQID